MPYTALMITCFERQVEFKCFFNDHWKVASQAVFDVAKRSRNAFV